MLSNESGNSNYPFYKEEPNQKKNSPLFGIEEVGIRNLKLLVVAEKHNHRSEFDFETCTFDLGAAQGLWTGRISTNGKVRHLQFGDAFYARNKDILLNSHFTFNANTNILQLEHATIKSGPQRFEIDGLIGTSKGPKDIDLVVKSDKAELDYLFSCLPPNSKSKITEYNPRADCDLELRLRSFSDGSGRLTSELQAQCEQLIIEQTRSERAIVLDRAELTYSNLKNRLGIVSVNNVSGTLDDQPIRGSIGFENLNHDPTIEASLSGILIPLEWMGEQSDMFRLGTDSITIDSLYLSKTPGSLK